MDKLDISLLYVEDDINTIRLLSSLLDGKIAGFSSALNGRKGLQEYNKKRPDIILTDLNMPVMDGFDFIETVREKDQLVKIIVLSGIIDQENLIQLINLGVDKFIPKPFQPRVFFKILEDLAGSILLPRKLAESENKYKKIIDSANDAIILTDSKTGEVLDANLKAEELFKIKKSGLIGMKQQLLFPEDEYKNKIENIFKEIKSGKKLKITESLILTAHKKTIEVEISPSIIEMENSTLILEIIRDIRKRKKSEKELIQAKEVAVEANIQKSTFLANMSHEIRTPMNGINGMITLLKKTKLTAEQQEFIDIMHSSSSTLLEILDDLIDISKVETGNIKIRNFNFNIREHLKSIVRTFQLKALKKNIDFRFEVDGKIPDLLNGDHLRIKQIVSNLIGNAIKFTQTGWVELKVTVAKKKKRIIYLDFTVKDTGIGIAEEKREIIFDIFSQVDPTETRKFGGTGLGLAISRKLADLMGGSITVESEMGKGSTFCFQLPMKMSLDTEEYAAGLKNSIKIRPLTILLAEDDFISRKFLVSLLNEKNHEVDIVGNGVDVISMFKKKYYDCILMDIQMPEMNGIDATKQIRELEKSSKSHIPIIAITANTLLRDKERFLDAGMDDFIGKPIPELELLKLLKLHCSKNKLRPKAL